MKTVLVTGGTRGIGLAVSEHLACEGWRVAISYRSDIASAHQCMERFLSKAYDVALFQSDQQDPMEARSLPERVVTRWGRLDAMVCNAGTTDDGSFLSMNSSRYHSVLQTNLFGTMRIVAAGIPHLLQSDTRAIVILSSLAGISGKEGQVAYATSKGGLIGFTQLMGRRYGSQGLRINAVAPGFVRTDMVKTLDTSMYEHILQGTALGRMGEAQEVAAAVSFLLHPGYVQSTTLKLDGGFKR